MKSSSYERRMFLMQAATIAAATIAGTGTSVKAVAAEHEGHSAMLGKGGADGYTMSTSVENRCATCNFWGGERRVSADGKELTVGGLGWCNNPDSPNYLKLTSPEHGPMDMWRKWSVLG